jgi:cystathionine beta-lyase
MFEEIIDRSHTGSLKWDKYASRDVLPMWVADMDFRSPPAVLHALRERVSHGVFGYTLPDAELMQVLYKYLKDAHGFEVEREWIIWLPGLVPALNLTCRAFPGDILTLTPVYPPFLTAPRFSGQPCTVSPLQPRETHWEIDWDDLESKIRPETSVLLLCNPHNPVGKVFRREELERLGELACRHDFVVCSDEIHCDLILDPKEKHIPMATLAPEVQARTISLYAPSKTYNLPGLSCSFAVISDPSLRKQFKKTIRGIITEVNAMGYAACRTAYREGEAWRRELLVVLRENRDFLYQFVADHCPEIQMLPMAATYLAWMDVRALELDDPAEWFESHGLGLSDGRSFGDAGAGYLRMNFGCPRETLEAGCMRLLRGVRAARAKRKVHHS